MAAVDWVQDMITRWVRIISAAGAGATPLDEAVHQISALGEAPGKKAGFGRLKRNAGPVDEASAVTVLCRQLIAGVLISDLLIDRVCEMSGQTREQALDQLIGDVTRELDDQQLRTLQVELSGSCKTLQDPNRASYGALGSRVEEVLALAEQQAREIVSAARAAATEITASARAQQPGSAHDIP